MRMRVRKRALQVSWDISMETYLGVRPIGPAQNWPQPDKKAYRRIFCSKFAGEVEPAYTCPLQSAHHLAAAVALDQLAQRHLAPLSCIPYPEVQKATGWCDPPQPFSFRAVTPSEVQRVVDDAPRRTAIC